jgi:hypothetical protein
MPISLQELRSAIPGVRGGEMGYEEGKGTGSWEMMS